VSEKKGNICQETRPPQKGRRAAKKDPDIKKQGRFRPCTGFTYCLSIKKVTLSSFGKEGHGISHALLIVYIATASQLFKPVQ